MMTPKPKASDDLSPCPFCGATEKLAIDGGLVSGSYVECGTCRARGPVIDALTNSTALAMQGWNTRRFRPAKKGKK